MNKLKGNDELCYKLINLVKGLGMSIKAAAEQLGVAPRSAQEFFVKEKQWQKEWWDKEEDNIKEYFKGFKIARPDSPKILFIDIESAPLAGAIWSLWNNNVSLNQLERDWYILSFAAKWHHEDEVIYFDKADTWEDENDKPLLEEAWKLLDEADIVVGQNSKAFDEKKLNARFILNGMKPPAPYKSVDTCEIAKKKFGFTSNKLEYMTDKLCVKYKKLKHEKFAGYELWKQCLKGNPEAWAEMQDYNKFDVLALEELYTIMRPWYPQHPNVNWYHETNDHVCSCGSSDWSHNGYHYTAVSKFDRFTCNNCGTTTRGRVNLFPISKRQSLKIGVM